MKLSILFRAMFPVLRLGLFDFGLSSKKGKTTQNQTASGTETGTSSTTESGTGTQKAASTGLETLVQLPVELQGALTALALQLAKDSKGEGSTNLAQVLSQRAEGADVDLQNAINSIISERERIGQRDIDQRVTQLAAAAGSSQNSFVQQVGSQATADLQSSLAGVQGQLEIDARKQTTNEFATALTANSANSTDLTNIVGALRGATQSRETSGSQDVSTTTDSNSLTEIAKVLNSTTTGVSKSKETGFSLGFGF